MCRNVQASLTRRQASSQSYLTVLNNRCVEARALTCSLWLSDSLIEHRRSSQRHGVGEWQSGNEQATACLLPQLHQVFWLVGVSVSPYLRNVFIWWFCWQFTFLLHTYFLLWPFLMSHFQLWEVCFFVFRGLWFMLNWSLWRSTIFMACQVLHPPQAWL